VLPVSALDVAVDLARSRELLLSEALAVGAREGSGMQWGWGSELHWDEEVGRQRLAEVMGTWMGWGGCKGRVRRRRGPWWCLSGVAQAFL
jgi:hypothetical protein